MDEAAIEALRQQLDSELARADPHIGIAFGWELYRAFGRRGWLTQETFSVAGTGAFPIQVIAYNGTHNAVVLWDLDDWECKVGTR